VLTFLLMLLAWVGLTRAEPLELRPTNSSKATLIEWSGGAATCFPLEPGRTLEYSVYGPVALTVEVRQLLPRPGQIPEPALVRAFGDGKKVLDIKVQQTTVPGGRVLGGGLGFPTVPDVARFTVPAGGRSLSLRAPSAGSEFLIRVLADEAPPAPALAALAPTPAAPPVVAATPALVAAPAARPAATRTAARPQTAGPPAGSRPAAEPSPTDNPSGEPAVVVAADKDPVVEPEPTVAADLAPPEVAVDLTPDLELEPAPARTWVVPNVSVGPVLGIGGPLRGDGMVLYLGARQRSPLIEDLLDLSAAAGWYRIGVAQEFRIVDPYLGAVQGVVSYRTNVVPIEVDAVLRIPLELGVVRPIVGAGPGVYVATRSADEGRTTAVTVGLQAMVGLDLQPEAGMASLALIWGGARRDFGNIGVDGDTVRESLSTVRVDATWQFSLR
jgi:hypothetical protein